MEAQSESKQREAVLIAGSVVVYCLSVSAVPIYNKAVFRSGIGGAAYPSASSFWRGAGLESRTLLHIFM